MTFKLSTVIHKEGRGKRRKKEEREGGFRRERRGKGGRMKGSRKQVTNCVEFQSNDAVQIKKKLYYLLTSYSITDVQNMMMDPVSAI